MQSAWKALVEKVLRGKNKQTKHQPIAVKGRGHAAIKHENHLAELWHQ